MRRATQLAAAGALAVAVALGAGACSDDEVERDPATVDETPVATDGPSPTAECADLVPDAVLAALGWDPDGPAVLESDRCERRVAAAGAVTVGTRAVPPGDDAREAALDAHDGYCRDLVSGPDQDLSWLEVEGPACGELLPPEGTGVAELLWVTADDAVVQVRVEALRPVTRDQLVDALGQLAERAEAAY